MREFLLLIVALVPVALLPAAPVPKDAGDVREEEFDWKGEKRKRTVRTLALGGEKVEFVKVPKGSFIMGSPESDDEAREAEKPQYKVKFTKPLWVAKYPVTKGQFAAFVKAAKFRPEAEVDGKGGYGFVDNRSLFPQDAMFSWKETGWEQTARHPVVNVTWTDAVAFCKWAKKTSEQPIRLLAEAEYEYANRGGEKTIHFTGDGVASLEGYANVADVSATKAWICSGSVKFDDGEAFTSPCGSYKPNGFGLYDTTGNVSCWCADWYDGKAFASLRRGVTDPAPFDEGEKQRRICRGGSWKCHPQGCRAASRHGYEPANRSPNLGFRVAFGAE